MTSKLASDPRIDPRIKAMFGAMGDLTTSGNVASREELLAEANTEVLVKDGDTSVIGGVYVVNRSTSKAGLPGLYKIPFLGFLFRSSSRIEDRRELLVFLTPRIITRSQPVARTNN